MERETGYGAHVRDERKKGRGAAREARRSVREPGELELAEDWDAGNLDEGGSNGASASGARARRLQEVEAAPAGCVEADVERARARARNCSSSSSGCVRRRPGLWPRSRGRGECRARRRLARLAWTTSRTRGSFAWATAGGMHQCGHRATRRTEPQAREKCKNAQGRGRPTPVIGERKKWGRSLRGRLLVQQQEGCICVGTEPHRELSLRLGRDARTRGVGDDRLRG